MAHYLLIKYSSIDLNKIKDDNKVRCRKERVCTNPASLREGGGPPPGSRKRVCAFLGFGREWWKESAQLQFSARFTSIYLSNPLQRNQYIYKQQ